MENAFTFKKILELKELRTGNYDETHQIHQKSFQSQARSLDFLAAPRVCFLALDCFLFLPTLELF